MFFGGQVNRLATKQDPAGTVPAGLDSLREQGG
jgi:hypothetical protein